MKKYIQAKTNQQLPDILIEKIVSLVLVDDARNYNPKGQSIMSSSRNRIDYSKFSREQLLELPKKVRDSIHDINVLRKLKFNELTLQQQWEVEQANKENFTSTISEVKSALQKLKQVNKIFINGFHKNIEFIEEVNRLGGDVTDKDARNIVRQLHIKDYSYSTYSYLDYNWNSLLMVFEYNGDYTFDPLEDDGQPVTLKAMDIYIKIDIDNEFNEGYAAMSFHNPEFKLTHPYKDYPIEKEDF